MVPYPWHFFTFFPVVSPHAIFIQRSLKCQSKKKPTRVVHMLTFGNMTRRARASGLIPRHRKYSFHLYMYYFKITTVSIYQISTSMFSLLKKMRTEKLGF